MTTDRHRRHDAHRRKAQPWRAWYNLAAWQRRRAAQLRKQPLCERCLAEGRTTPATVAHHVIPHKGDWTLFIEGELASSCAYHHDTVEQGIEARGFDRAVDEHGWPTDPAHPANRKGPL